MSFPPFADARIYTDCLDQLWAKTELVASDAYHHYLYQILSAYTRHNHEACRKYMEAANAELLDSQLADVLDGEFYHPDLQRVFYSRICARILARVKKRGTNISDYFLANTHDAAMNNVRKNDIEKAVAAELKEITSKHTTLTREATLQAAPSDLINTFKYRNTWFKDVNNDLVLEVIEVIMDAVDKGNSLGNKITKQIALSHPEPLPDDSNDSSSNDAKHLVILNEFQIIGIIVSAAYLFLSIFTPLYKKLALGRDDPIINRWSLRYFIPSVILFTLGIVALTVPVTAMVIGIGFALYSLASNIFKVSVYFSFYFDLKQKIKDNLASINQLTDERNKLDTNIRELSAKHKTLAKNDEFKSAKKCILEITKLEKRHEQTTVKWLEALAKKEDLEVKGIRNFDKYTGFTNIFRLGLAIAGCIGLILTLIPPTAPIGAIIAFTVLCVGTVILATHHINKFRLIRQEKTLAKQKRDEFEPGYKELSSQADMLKKMDEKPISKPSKPEQEPLLATSPIELSTVKPPMKYTKSVIDLLFASPPASYHPDPDQDERPNPPYSSV